VAHGGPRALGVGAIESLADRAQLTLLELTDGEAAPAIGRPDDGRVHQLQYGPLSEGWGRTFPRRRSSRKQPLQEIGGADHAAMIGCDLTGRPLHDRRARLEDIVASRALVFPCDGSCRTAYRRGGR
jgi:hypothetical protein